MAAPSLLVLVALVVADGASLPEQTRDGMTARLTVHVADQGPQPGAALVYLTLTVTGGPLLEVEPPRLSDPVNAWEPQRNDWCWRDDGRLTWTESVALRQAKPGPAALPDMKVRFRAGPRAPWQEAEWLSPLKAPRDAPPPELTPSPPQGVPWLPWAGLAATAAALAVVGWEVYRRRDRQDRALPPDRRAAEELTRLGADAMSDLDSAEYHTRLSDVVRRYLTEQFGLPATRQTTGEFLETVRRTGRLPADQQALLRDLLERCDLAKFAPVAAPPEARREAAALARAFVGRTAGATRVIR